MCTVHTCNVVPYFVIVSITTSIHGMLTILQALFSMHNFISFSKQLQKLLSSPHFTDEEMEAEKKQVLCLRWHSKQVTGLGRSLVSSRTQQDVPSSCL